LSGDWKTPQKHDEQMQGRNRPIVNGRIQTHGGGSTSVNLALQAELNWRTPATTDVGTPLEKLTAVDGTEPKIGHKMYRDGKDGKRINQTQSLGLQVEIANWNTPSASIADAGATSRSGNRKGELLLAGQAAQENPNTTGKPRGSLNSAWVMQLMGWPDEYAHELTRLCCEWQATAGSTRSPK
jgi:hypothetical protein